MENKRKPNLNISLGEVSTCHAIGGGNRKQIEIWQAKCTYELLCFLRPPVTDIHPFCSSARNHHSSLVLTEQDPSFMSALRSPASSIGLKAPQLRLESEACN